MKIKNDNKEILLKIFDGILCVCDKIEHNNMNSSSYHMHTIIKYDDKIMLSRIIDNYSLTTKFNYIELTKEEYYILLEKIHQRQIIIADKELVKLKQSYVIC